MCLIKAEIKRIHIFNPRFPVWSQGFINTFIYVFTLLFNKPANMVSSTELKTNKYIIIIIIIIVNIHNYDTWVYLSQMWIVRYNYEKKVWIVRYQYVVCVYVHTHTHTHTIY